jgi:glyoxylase-like metal-dependent hydrolase (beta-lactamase superfamily II)
MTQPAARLQRWRIGDATVTRIEEQLGPGSFPPHQYFSGFEREVLERHLDWLVPHHYLPALDALVTSVHSWLIQTRHHTVLLDCCAGNHKDRPWWPRFHQLETPFLQRLALAGVAPEQVDIVMCTHLHADHIGWNTQLRDGRWVPTFPNARYLFSRAECEHWDPARHPEDTDDPHRRIAYVDSVLPVIEAGLAELVTGPHEIDDGLRIENAPGHTPGHILLTLAHADGGGVFCGDVIHHPLQVCAPHWNSQFCMHPDQARSTRRRVLEHCAESGACLLPTHFGSPHVARVRARGDEFRPVFVRPDGG